jgi:hypothetical protein
MWPIEILGLVTIHPVEIRPAMPRVPKTPSPLADQLDRALVERDHVARTISHHDGED